MGKKNKTKAAEKLKGAEGFEKYYAGIYRERWESLKAALEARDFGLLFDMHARVAETCLWETEHNARWLAGIESVLKAWQAYKA